MAPGVRRSKGSTGAFRPPATDRVSPFNKVATITRGTASVAFDYNGEHTRIRQVSASATTLYITDPATGVSFEKVTGSGGSIQWNLYVRAGDRLVAQRIDATPSGGGASTVAMRYFTTDHLGSIAVITDELGAVVERLSYDAWGKRRFPNGTDDPSGSITSQTTRGFTGHEMIDEVGLVNMNGRVYDPEIGRFMSADPIVQDPTDTQSLNRYSYVSNNPLSYTDPTGYFSLGKFLKTLIAIVVVIVAAIYGQGWLVNAGWGLTATEAAVIAGAVGGAIAGGITGGDLRSVLTGAISGALFARVGLATKGWGDVSRTVAMGTTGGVTSVIQGGNFQSGFLAAGFSSLAQPYIDVVANDNAFVGATAAAAVGGTASVLGGGKFANGAVTGAFSYAVGKAIGPGNDNLPADHNWHKANGKLAGDSMSDAVNDPMAQAAESLSVEGPYTFTPDTGVESPWIDPIDILTGGTAFGVKAIFRLGGKAATTRALAVDANKLTHIFGNSRHNLGPLVQKMGSQEAAFTAVQRATQTTVRAQGLSGVFETTVSVAGQNIVVRGNAIDGTARIGTFFIP